MKKCPECGEEFPEAAMICKKDRRTLVRVPSGPTSPDRRPSSFTNPDNDRGANTSGDGNMLLGGVICLIGIIVTVVTYSNARGGGGHYVVAWGAIVFGAIRFLKGLASK